MLPLSIHFYVRGTPSLMGQETRSNAAGGSLKVKRRQDHTNFKYAHRFTKKVNHSAAVVQLQPLKVKGEMENTIC